MNSLTHDRLIELLEYNSLNGIFSWKISRGLGRPGTEAGAIRDRVGYRHIVIDRKSHFAHRLAWFYVHGTWPKKQIDHIDGNKLNNRIENLREATPGQNLHNRPVHPKSKTGIKGVYKINNSFYSQTRFNGKQIYLGCFKTSEEAATAYRAKVLELHGEFVHQSIAVSD